MIFVIIGPPDDFHSPESFKIAAMSEKQNVHHQVKGSGAWKRRGLAKRSGEGNGIPLQYSCLENPMDGGAWWAAVHGVAKSQI